ncbi:hypothetical protein Patl1_21591 [Pistacia atlantica]|uniref:Uncharacterized protein n=1 Tax=Pistacia atlantica TaxID=434234 RepID=A0ACC1BN09_9ROSI|nr:hypothetical protein Patl1_21591 [Pistacia atlantica]
MINKGSVPVTGLNFASASCGILPESGSTLGKCLHLDEQIDLFEDTIKSNLPTYFDSSEKFSDYLSKSVFIISTGSNDYMCNYLQPKFFNTSKIYAPQPFAQLLIDALSPKLERLYNLGARKIVMFEIGAVGCIPAMKREGIKCVEDKNQLVSYFNDGLLAMLRNLTTTLKGSNFVLGHAHWLGYDAATNPSKYGLTNANNPCCTTWRNGESACIPFLKPCPKADKFYFWDGFHPTEAVHSLIASGCINNASVCIPVTLKDLVNM